MGSWEIKNIVIQQSFKTACRASNVLDKLEKRGTGDIIVLAQLELHAQVIVLVLVVRGCVHLRMGSKRHLGQKAVYHLVLGVLSER